MKKSTLKSIIRSIINEVTSNMPKVDIELEPGGNRTIIKRFFVKPEDRNLGHGTRELNQLKSKGPLVVRRSDLLAPGNFLTNVEDGPAVTRFLQKNGVNVVNGQ